jgi:hypothetical protein
MSREAMQMALHTLEGWANYGKWVWPESALEQAKRNTTESIAALRQALDTEQEPVAWITNGGKGELWWHRSSKFDEEGNLIGPNPDDIPLYTAPPKKEWVGLTEEEIISIGNTANLKAKATSKGIIIHPEGIKKFYQTIEAKLKERNG